MHDLVTITLQKYLLTSDTSSVKPFHLKYLLTDYPRCLFSVFFAVNQTCLLLTELSYKGFLVMADANSSRQVCSNV